MRFWLIVVWVLALSVRAHADDAADIEEAGREFGAGQSADRAGNWQLAIQHYLRANDLVPHPNAMFNIATDYERLGKLREAAVWYQRYIDNARSAPDRDRIVRLLRELATRPATVTIRSNPTSRISIDGKYLHESPFTGKLPGGRHRVMFEHDGQREYRDLSLEFGEPAVLDVTLLGETGTVRVDGSPYGAAVTIDDEPAGPLPASKDVVPGPHFVRVTQQGYAPFEATIEVRPHQIMPVRAQLTRALGTIDGTGGRTVHAGYLLGAGGGADLKGEGALLLVDLGIQALHYDAAVRIGKTAGVTALDFVARWAIGDSRVAPYVGLGYGVVSSPDSSTSSSGSGTGGWVVIGGLRLAMAKNEHTVLSLIVESGIRYYPGLSVTGDPTRGVDGRSGLIVPLMGSVQVVYK